MNIKNKEVLPGFLFAAPSILGFVIFFAYPSIISIYYCFTDGINASQFVGFNNFKSLFSSNSYLLALKNTFVFNLISVPLIMVISFSIALILNSKLKLVNNFRTLLIMPLVVPVVSVVIVWNNLIQTELALPLLILLYIWKNCGYNIILYLAGLNNIPKVYYDYAYLEGAGKIKCFMYITFPYLIPTTFFVFIISLINSFKVFKEAYLLAGDYPNTSIYMLQHFMNNNFNNLNYQRLSTASLIMTIIIISLVIVLYVIEKKFRENR